VQVAGHTYDRTEVDSSTRQFPPVPYEGSYAHRIVSMDSSRPRFIGNTYYRALQSSILRTITRAEVDSLPYQDIQESTPTFNPHPSIILLATGQVITRIVQRQRPSERRFLIKLCTLPRWIYIQRHWCVHIRTCPRDWLILICSPRKFKHTLPATCRSQIAPMTGRKLTFPLANLHWHRTGDQIHIEL